MFCVAYAAMIFGMEKIPIDILNIIDQCRGEDDGYFKEAGHKQIKNNKREAGKISRISAEMDLIAFDYNYFSNDLMENDYSDGYIVLSNMELSPPTSALSDKSRLRYKIENGQVDIFLNKLRKLQQLAMNR